MDEMPFALDAAIDVLHADRHRGASIAIEQRVSTVSDRYPPPNPRAPTKLHGRAREHKAKCLVPGPCAIHFRVTAPRPRPSRPERLPKHPAPATGVAARCPS